MDVSRILREEGPAGIARRARQRATRLIRLDETHIWYALDLDRVEELPLADGYELRQAADGDVPSARALTGISSATISERRALGAQLWLVVRDDEAAFNCWIFPHVTPVRAAAGRWLDLPQGVACLEDSFTAAPHRGHGIAGAAWTRIASGLSRQGFRVLITKVEVSNSPSRRAVEKAGFREACRMLLRSRMSRDTVTLEPLGSDLTSGERSAAEQLERRLARD